MKFPLVLIIATVLSTAAGVPGQATSPAAPDGQLDADVCIVGGTPGGVACAVRAAREGMSVLLVNRHDHLGGLLTSGISVWDSQFEGKRSPVYDEVCAGRPWTR